MANKLDAAAFKAHVLDNAGPVLVDFSATWCGPCKLMKPVVDELSTTYAGRADVAVVDIDDEGGLAASYGVQSVPTFLFFQNGEVVDQVIGAAPKAVLTRKLEALLG